MDRRVLTITGLLTGVSLIVSAVCLAVFPKFGPVIGITTTIIGGLGMIALAVRD